MSRFPNTSLRRWSSASAGYLRRIPLIWIALIFVALCLAWFGPIKRYFHAHPGAHSSRAYYAVHVETDGLVHPVHLTGPGGAEGRFHLLVVNNLSSQYPLALMAFSTRPGASAQNPQQQLVDWAKWIISQRQVIQIQPGHSWALKPADLTTLNAQTGHTWLALFYEPSRPQQDLTAPTLPASYHGAFDIYYRPSALAPRHLQNPEMWKTEITEILSREIDLTDKVQYGLPPLDLRGHNGLTAPEMQP